MGLIPKWLRDWISSLMPKQESSGNGTVHIGSVAGSVKTVTLVTHQHFYASLPPPQDAPSFAAAEPRRHATEAQREVLARMRSLDRDARSRVLAFMRREFNTTLVVELNADQLKRLRSYVETVKRNEERGKERA